METWWKNCTDLSTHFSSFVIVSLFSISLSLSRSSSHTYNIGLMVDKSTLINNVHWTVEKPSRIREKNWSSSQWFACISIRLIHFRWIDLKWAHQWKCCYEGPSLSLSLWLTQFQRVDDTITNWLIECHFDLLNLPIFIFSEVKRAWTN